MDEGDRSEIYKKAMREVPGTRDFIVRELRDMAAARGIYTRFTHFPPYVTGVWSAAADIMEQDEKDKRV